MEPKLSNRPQWKLKLRWLVVLLKQPLPQQLANVGTNAIGCIAVANGGVL